MSDDPAKPTCSHPVAAPTTLDKHEGHRGDQVRRAALRQASSQARGPVIDHPAQTRGRKRLRSRPALDQARGWLMTHRPAGARTAGLAATWCVPRRDRRSFGPRAHASHLPTCGGLTLVSRNVDGAGDVGRRAHAGADADGPHNRPAKSSSRPPGRGLLTTSVHAK